MPSHHHYFRGLANFSFVLGSMRGNYYTLSQEKTIWLIQTTASLDVVSGVFI